MDKALIAAGFKPKDELTLVSKPKINYHAIRQMRKDKLPLYAKYVMKHRSKLFSSARRELGCWKTALRTANINLPRYAIGRRIHKLVEALHDLDGESMNAAPHQLRECAIYYFGSVENGLMAAEAEPRVVSGWNKAKITAEVKRMQRPKQSLSYGLVRRNYPSLVYATENHFSSSVMLCLLRVSTLIRFTSALNGTDKNLLVSDEAHGTVPRSPLPALLTAI